MALSEEQIENRLRENIGQVKERIAAAAKRGAAQRHEATLVAVTKYVEPHIARLVVANGVVHLGESRPQSLWNKAEALADISVNWHLIGHLQRNKVKRTLPLVTCIHSADSLRLLQEIDTEAAHNPLPVADVLLEVNVSGESAKHGIHPNEVEPLLPEIAELKHVSVLGLMTMASGEGGLDEARRNFSALRELREHLRINCPPSILLNELSMGMSEDFEVAIEEGATIVRVGSALFEGVV